MKSRFLLRFLSFVSLFLVLIGVFSCKTARNVFDSECYIFENQTDYKNYFVKLDSVGNSDVSGRIYLIDDNLTLQAEPFLLVFDRKKSEVILSDTTFYVLKVRKTKNGRVEGYFSESSKKKKFIFYPYQLFENINIF